MSLILAPFRFIAGIFGFLGKGIGVVVAAFVSAWLMRYVLCALAYNGVVNVSQDRLTIGMLIAFGLTLMAGFGGKK